MASIYQIEPLTVREASRHYPKLLELGEELKHEASMLCSKAAAYAPDKDKIAITNAHFSNAIEGHLVAQKKIEETLNNLTKNEPIADDYLAESIAHIKAQRWLEEKTNCLELYSISTTQRVHQRFFEEVPESLRRTSGDRIKEIKPGELRNEEVPIGQHIAVKAKELPKFIKHFDQGYARLSGTNLLIAIAAIHHRFLWMHPFLDGNGRVARMISQNLFDCLLNTSNLWSLSKGLYEQRDKYRNLLAQCDQARRNDLDGRGNLSEEALATFTVLLLETSIAQLKLAQ